MAHSCGSLPPLLDSPVEGSLNLIILRPVLIPPLLPDQSVNIRFTWWGDEEPCRVCMPPEKDEIKLFFNVTCDIKCLRRYLKDAKQLRVSLNIKGNNDQSSKPNLLKAKYAKYRKQWEEGEYVGSFILNNLKLNTRGEYINECTVYDNFEQYCGSVAVFMLHSDNEISFASSGNQENDNTQLSVMPDLISEECSRNLQSERIHNTPVYSYIPTEKQSDTNDITTISSSTSTCKMKHVFDSPTSSPKTRQLTQLKSNLNHQNSAKKRNGSEKCNKSKENRFESHHIETKEADMASFSESISMNPGNSNFILTRLFPFVDSGAISVSDLPLLMQICQGRSPSVDFGAAPSMDIYNSYSESLLSKYNPIHSILKNSDLSMLSSHSGIWPLDNPIHKVDKSNDKVIIPNSKSDEGASDPIPNTDFGQLNTRVCSSPEGIEKCSLDTGCSLMILNVASLVLDGILEYSKTSKSAASKGIPVRFQSKVCYMVHFGLYFTADVLEDEVVFVSRQIHSGVIKFNCNRIFRLSAGVNNIEGFLRIRVTRRTLGQRNGEEIAICVVSLRDIFNYNDTLVELMLWLPNKRATDDNSEELKKPVGRLIFRVTFALSEDVTKDKTVEEINEFDLNGGTEITSNSLFPRTPNALKRSNVSPAVPTSQQQHLFTEGTRVNMDQDLNSNSSSGSQIMEKMLKNERVEELSDKKYNFRDIDVNHGQQHDVNSHQNVDTSLYNTEDVSRLDLSHLILEPDGKNEKICKLHLEILNAEDILCVRIGESESIKPNCYVKASLPTFSIVTRVCRHSCDPVWNFEADVSLQFGDLLQTKGHLILKIYHSLRPAPELSDPMIGFCSINTDSLKSGFVSLCGWFPVLSITGESCGRIKVSLTPYQPPGDTKNRKKPSDPNMRKLQPNKKSHPERINLHGFENQKIFSEDDNIPENQKMFSEKPENQKIFSDNRPENQKILSNNDHTQLFHPENTKLTTHQISETKKAENPNKSFIQRESSYERKNKENKQPDGIICCKIGDYPPHRHRNDNYEHQTDYSDNYWSPEVNNSDKLVDSRSNSCKLITSSVVPSQEISHEKISRNQDVEYCCSNYPQDDENYTGPMRRSSIPEMHYLNQDHERETHSYDHFNEAGVKCLENESKCVPTSQMTNHLMEQFCWMNQSNFDSPCVSYMSVYSQVINEETKDLCIQSSRKTNVVSTKLKKRKSRIAANLGIN